MNETIFGILTGLIIVFVIALATGAINIQGFIGLFLITTNPIILLFLIVKYMRARAESRARDEEES